MMGFWGMASLVTLSVAAIAALFAIAALVRRLRAAREAQRTAEAKLEIVECIAEVGTWQTDDASQFVDWSPHVFAIHCRNPARGRPTLDEAIAYYHPDDRDMVSATVARARSEGEDFEYHARIVDETGRLRHVLARGAARFADGKVAGIFGSVIEMRGGWERVAEPRALAEQY